MITYSIDGDSDNGEPLISTTSIVEKIFIKKEKKSFDMRKDSKKKMIKTIITLLLFNLKKDTQLIILMREKLLVFKLN